MLDSVAVDEGLVVRSRSLILSHLFRIVHVHDVRQNLKFGLNWSTILSKGDHAEATGCQDDLQLVFPTSEV